MAFRAISKSSIISSKEKRQQLLWISLFILVLIVFVVAYLNFWRSPSTPLINISALGVPDLPFVASKIPVKEILKEIDFDNEFLKNDSFLDLKSYGEWPLKIEQKGRPNPFLP